jgi:predicted nucleic-acid-binding protein
MIAVDTNLLVRLLTQDDAQQAQRTAKLINREAQVFVGKTVLLETAWVLRSAYGFESYEIVEAFQRLGGMSNIFFEDTLSIITALQWVKEYNLDIADAIHLATAQTVGAQPFYSFDRLLITRAKNLAAEEPEI